MLIISIKVMTLIFINQVKLKAQRATEIWKVPPLSKTPANIKSYPKLCIVTPATSSKRSLNDPTAFSYDVSILVYYPGVNYLAYGAHTPKHDHFLFLF